MYTPWFWIINLNQVTMCWGWTLWESEYWTSAVREKILTSIIQNGKNNVKHWNITFHVHCFFLSNDLVVMALDSQFRGLMFKTIKVFLKKVEMLSTWQNSLLERDNNSLLFHWSPYYTEVHKPERRRYICMHMAALRIKTEISTWNCCFKKKKNSKKSLKAISGLYLTEINEVKLA